MTARHTPGPLVAKFDLTHNAWAVIDAAGETVAHVVNRDGDHQPDNMARRSAELFAASPEMFAALAQAYAELAAGPALEAVRAAMGKAVPR